MGKNRQMSVKQARIVLSTYRIQPNKSESRLLEFLNFYFPGKFMYNGGQILVEGKVPDFIDINGQKVFLELAGKRFHDVDEMKTKCLLYKRYGFRTLVIWSDEVRAGREDSLLEKIYHWYHNRVVDGDEFGLEKENYRPSTVMAR